MKKKVTLLLSIALLLSLILIFFGELGLLRNGTREVVGDGVRTDAGNSGMSEMTEEISDTLVPDGEIQQSVDTINENTAEKKGICGNYLKWFYRDQVLVIRGTGEMNANPWKREVQSDISVVVIEEGCTSVWRDAFSDNENLRKVILPNGITQIGDRAFDNCYRLAEIDLPESLVVIGDEAFHGCAGLKEVSLRNENISIGDGAFAFCDGRTTAPICTLILDKGVHLEGMINCIPLSEFQTIRLGADDADYVSVDDVVFSKDRTVLIYCPKTKSGSYTIPDSVTAIGEEAFKFCTNLTEIVIPNSVSDIGYEAFGWCAKLTNVDIPSGVAVIGEYAFEKCTGLNRVSLPDGMEKICDGTFYNCTGLREIVIPDRVTHIGAYAFYKCAGLLEVTIPDSVTSIGSCAFEGCTGLREIAIPDSVVSIGDGAFYKCTGLINAVIPGRTALGEAVLSGCDGLATEADEAE